MAADRNKEIVTAYVAAFNRGDVEAVCKLFSPDALVWGVLGWGEIAKAKPIWAGLMSSFGINLTIESIVAEANIVAVRYTERGTFTKAFRGSEPTGKSYELVAMEWFELKDGLIHRRWGARDSASQAKQLGMAMQ